MHSIFSILQSATQQIDRLDAGLLIGHILRKSREFVVAHPEMKVNRIKSWKIKRLVDKRKNGMPLAYLTGHKEFYGLDFFVNKHTLIPRPETEMLIDAAIEELRKIEDEGSVVYADIGTGSGCVAISVMHALQHENMKTREHKNMKAFGVDCSLKALRMATKNAKKHGADVTFLRGDLLHPLIQTGQLRLSRNKPADGPSSRLMITANLPYLTKEQYRDSPTPEIYYEPKSALVAADEGLALYKKLLQQLADLDISSISCFFEIDSAQSTPLSAYMHQFFPNATVEIKKDLAGRDRIFRISYIY